MDAIDKALLKQWVVYNRHGVYRALVERNYEMAISTPPAYFREWLVKELGVDDSCIKLTSLRTALRTCTLKKGMKNAMTKPSEINEQERKSKLFTIDNIPEQSVKKEEDGIDEFIKLRKEKKGKGLTPNTSDKD